VHAGEREVVEGVMLLKGKTSPPADAHANSPPGVQPSKQHS